VGLLVVAFASQMEIVDGKFELAQLQGVLVILVMVVYQPEGVLQSLVKLQLLVNLEKLAYPHHKIAGLLLRVNLDANHILVKEAKYGKTVVRHVLKRVKIQIPRFVLNNVLLDVNLLIFSIYDLMEHVYHQINALVVPLKDNSVEGLPPLAVQRIQYVLIILMMAVIQVMEVLIVEEYASVVLHVNMAKNGEIVVPHVQDHVLISLSVQDLVLFIVWLDVSVLMVKYLMMQENVLIQVIVLLIMHNVVRLNQNLVNLEIKSVMKAMHVVLLMDNGSVVLVMGLHSHVPVPKLDHLVDHVVVELDAVIHD